MEVNVTFHLVEKFVIICYSFMVHSFHEALRATFHELSENYNPRGSIVYVVTRQRSIVIILIIIVS